MADEKRLMVLDSASMYFRAFFGVPEVLAPDGTPVNAVRGFLDFISRLVGDYRPTHLVCAWDNDWRPQWRVDLIPSYKAHRVVVPKPGPTPDIEEVPDPLEIQVPVILEVLDAVGLCVVGADGYEADDVIGTLATGAGMPVDVVTGDRDLFQLVDDRAGVRVLYIARGVGNHERVTDARRGREVPASSPASTPTSPRCAATPPTVCPGCPASVTRPRRRCSSPTGTSTGIQAAAADPTSEMSPGPRRKILDAADYLAVAPTVVAVARDAALPSYDATLPAAPRDPARVDALAERYSLDSPLKRLRAVLAG